METLVTVKVSVVLCPNMTDIDTRTRIREKAHQLFWQYGLRSVSMDDIASSMGISKKTIYLNYADKDELVDAVVESEFKKNESICEHDKKHSKNAIDEMFMAMDMVVETFSTMNPGLVYDLQKYYPGAFQKFHRYKNDYLYNVIRDNIIRGINEELYRPEMNVDIIARFRVESVMIPFNPEFYTRMKYSLVQIEEEFIVHFLFGMASPKGYKMILKYQQERINKSKDGNN
jgi:AcrR family transcriptional regulator